MEDYNPSGVGDYVFYKTAKWEKKFAWFPKRCSMSRALIWLTYGYKGTANYGPSEMVPAKEVHWHSKTQHIFWELTNELKRF